MEATKTIDDMLRDAGITMSADHVPTTFNIHLDEWQHIAWRVTFSGPHGKFTTDYKQGIGHLPKELALPARYTMWQLDRVGFALRTGHVPFGNGDTFSKGKPLTAPTASDVVQSLMSDTDAANYGTYEAWAEDAGYDTDSRKGEKIYQQCRNIALDLLRVFGGKLLDDLKSIRE